MIDWDDAFDNSGYVDGAAQLAGQWVTEAETYRASLVAQQRAQLDLGYGAGEREVFDLFHPDETPKGLSLIHISEPTRLGMISYAVFCLKKKNA